MSSSSDGKDFTTQISADPSDFEAGMQRAAKAAAQTSAQIDAQFKKIGDTFSNVTKLFTGLTAVLAGGGALKKFIDDTTNWNGEAAKMAKQLGITTQQASVLNVALNHLGIDSDVYTTAANKLSKQITNNAQAFDVMGVKVKDAAGAYRPVTDVMTEVNAKIGAISNTVARDEAGRQAYGKSWSEIRAILKLTNDEMAAAEKRARQLGLIVGPEGAAMTKQYEQQMRDLDLVGKSLEIQFGNQLLPVFTRIGAAMSDMSGFAKALATVMETVVILGANVAFVFEAVGREIGAIAAQLSVLATGGSGRFAQFRAISDAVKADGERARAELDFFEKKLLRGGAQGASAAAKPEPKKEGAGYNFAKEGAAAPSRMGEWEAQLAERKAALEREGMVEGQYREMSKADELKYWQDLKNMQGLSDTEKLSLTRKTADTEMAMTKQNFEVQVATLEAQAAAFKNNTEERMRLELAIQAKYADGTKEYEQAAKRIVEIQRQAADQERTIRQMRVQAERDARLQSIALEEQAVQQNAQLGALSQQQVLTAQMRFEQQRNAIALEALNERLQDALADPDRNPAELEKIHEQIEALEQQHQLRMAQIKKSMQLDNMAPLTAVFKAAEASISNAIQGVINRTMSLKQAMASLWKGISSAIIQELSNILAKKLAVWAVERTMALLGIKTKAAEGGAGAAKAVADTPYVGPALAVAAMAAIFAAVMGMQSSVPSASGGFDIPGTLNPLTQLHANEMVLPAKHADVIRELADGDDARASGQPLTVHIHATDAESVRRLILNNSSAVADAIKQAHRNFAFKGVKA